MLAHLALVEKQDQLVIVVYQVIRVCLVRQDSQVSQVNQVKEDCLDQRELQEQRVHQDFKVSQVKEDCQDLQAKMVEKEKSGQVALMAPEETKVNKAWQDPLVVKDLLEDQAHKEKLDFREEKVIQVNLE